MISHCQYFWRQSLVVLTQLFFYIYCLTPFLNLTWTLVTEMLHNSLKILHDHLITSAIHFIQMNAALRLLFICQYIIFFKEGTMTLQYQHHNSSRDHTIQSCKSGTLTSRLFWGIDYKNCSKKYSGRISIALIALCSEISKV